MSKRLYQCKHCGNILATFIDGNVIPQCCNEKMHEMVPFEVDGAKEKHIPVVEIKGNEVHVKIGEVEHPMTNEHYIQFVTIVTDKGIQMKKLRPNEKAEVIFPILEGEQIKATFAYCNLHGLWKK